MLTRFLGEQSFQKLVEKAAIEIRKWVNEGSVIRVISHLDADGLSAAGILGLMLYRSEASFKIRITRWMNEEVLTELAEESDSPIIFADSGSGYLDLIGEHLKSVPVIVLDHHEICGTPTGNIVHVNPHLCGIDGAKDLSGAGAAYFAAKAFDEENMDLSHLAIVGALGDMQDSYEGRSLGGLNTLIVEDAVKSGVVEVERDLLFYGRETRPIHKALAYTTNPFIPGLSGEEDKCLALLAEVGIEIKKGGRWRALRDLSEEEKKKLFSAIVNHVASMGLADVAMKLIGAVYTLVKEEPWTPLRDGREYASLLNACGRMDKAGLGVAICMGDRGKALKEAQETLEEYRRVITSSLEMIMEEPGMLEEKRYIYVVHGGEKLDDKLVSTVSSILSGNLPKSKALIAYALTEDGIAKISARASGLKIDLAEIMRKSAEKFSGIGGGHAVAAGAQIPAEKIKDFIDYVDKLVGGALRGS